MAHRILMLLALCLMAAPALAVEPVVVTLIPDGSVTAKPGSGSTVVERGKATATAKADGDEDIESCERYGRRSSANGRAAVTTVSAASPTSLSYRLDAAASASGGHYRTGTCFADRRIGFSGHDTEAKVDAVATAVVTIRFNGGRPNVPYFVKISRSQSGSAQNDQLTGPDGTVIPLNDPKSPYPVILSKPGQDYFLRTTVAATARNGGGCCSDQTSATSDMFVSIEPAPLLFAAGQSAFIAKGFQTTGYKNVVIIMLEGLPHCTATLISPTVLVTAAHCVEGHMTIDKMSTGKVLAVFGSSYAQPLFAPVQIVRASYPKDFVAATLQSDIAVAYLKTAVTVPGVNPAPLHTGIPSWQQIKADKTNLTFVGFGYDVVGGEKTGVGVKREASWAITDYTDGIVSFQTDGTSTCNGDSGGPAFLNVNQTLVLAAVTSGGDDNACSYGWDTRIDAYLDWLKQEIASK
jgi:V8-like Glu-specific endopeptidase